MKSTGLFRKALSAVLTLTMVVGMDAGQLANNALEVFAAEPETESTSPLSDALEDIASSLETGISSANAVTLVYKGETTYYDTLQKAIEAVTDKTEADITINEDVNVDEPIEIDAARKIVIDLDGHTVTSESGENIFINKGSLKLTGGTGSALVSGTAGESFFAFTIENSDTGSLEVADSVSVSAQAKEMACAIDSRSEGTVTVRADASINVEAENCIGIYSSGSLDLSGSVIAAWTGSTADGEFIAVDSEGSGIVRMRAGSKIEVNCNSTATAYGLKATDNFESSVIHCTVKVENSAGGAIGVEVEGTYIELEKADISVVSGKEGDGEASEHVGGIPAVGISLESADAEGDAVVNAEHTSGSAAAIYANESTAKLCEDSVLKASGSSESTSSSAVIRGGSFCTEGDVRFAKGITAENAELALCSGYYNSEPDAAWIAEGYKTAASDISEYAYMVVKQTVSAVSVTIDDATSYYETLAEAVEAVPDNTGADITVLIDPENETEINISASKKDLSIDLGGFTYDGTISNSGKYTTVKNGTIEALLNNSDSSRLSLSQVTVNSLTNDGSDLSISSSNVGTWTNKAAGNISGGSSDETVVTVNKFINANPAGTSLTLYFIKIGTLENTGKLILYDGVECGSLTNEGEVTVYDGSYSNITNTSAHNIDVEGGKFENGQIENNGTFSIFGGTFAEGCTIVNAEDGFILFNEGTFESGCIISNEGTMNVTGGYFSNTSSTKCITCEDGSTLSLTGGYFSTEVIVPTPDEGYMAIETMKGDPAYSLGYLYHVAETPAAQVITESDVYSYSSLSEAFEAASQYDASTVKVISDASESGEIVIPAGKTVYLDLNGRTLSAAEGQNLFTVNGTLYIDNNASGVGELSSTANVLTAGSGGTILVFDSYAVNQDDFIIVSGGLSCDETGMFTIYGGSYTNDPTAFLAAGYTAVQGSTYYTVNAEKVIVLTYNNSDGTVADAEYYSSAAEAVTGAKTAAAAGGMDITLSLLKSLDEIAIPDGDALILKIDLADCSLKTLSIGRENYVTVIGSGDALTDEDSAGKITGDAFTGEESIGKIIGDVYNYGTLRIASGAYYGKLNTDDGDISVTGGYFANEPDAGWYDSSEYAVFMTGDASLIYKVGNVSDIAVTGEFISEESVKTANFESIYTAASMSDPAAFGGTNSEIIYTLEKDITDLTSSVIFKGADVTLNVNGHTISGQVAKGSNSGLIINTGLLRILGSGVITATEGTAIFNDGILSVRPSEKDQPVSITGTIGVSNNAIFVSTGLTIDGTEIGLYNKRSGDAVLDNTLCDDDESNAASVAGDGPESAREYINSEEGGSSADLSITSNNGTAVLNEGNMELVTGAPHGLNVTSTNGTALEVREGTVAMKNGFLQGFKALIVQELGTFSASGMVTINGIVIVGGTLLGIGCIVAIGAAIDGLLDYIKNHSSSEDPSDPSYDPIEAMVTTSSGAVTLYSTVELAAAAANQVLESESCNLRVLRRIVSAPVNVSFTGSSTSVLSFDTEVALSGSITANNIQELMLRIGKITGDITANTNLIVMNSFEINGNITQSGAVTTELNGNVTGNITVNGPAETQAANLTIAGGIVTGNITASGRTAVQITGGKIGNIENAADIYSRDDESKRVDDKNRITLLGESDLVVTSTINCNILSEGSGNISITGAETDVCGYITNHGSGIITITEATVEGFTLLTGSASLSGDNATLNGVMPAGVDSLPWPTGGKIGELTDWSKEKMTTGSIYNFGTGSVTMENCLITSAIINVNLDPVNTTIVTLTKCNCSTVTVMGHLIMTGSVAKGMGTALSLYGVGMSTAVINASTIDAAKTAIGFNGIIEAEITGGIITSAYMSIVAYQGVYTINGVAITSGKNAVYIGPAAAEGSMTALFEGCTISSACDAAYLYGDGIEFKDCIISGGLVDGVLDYNFGCVYNVGSNNKLASCSLNGLVENSGTLQITDCKNISGKVLSTDGTILVNGNSNPGEPIKFAHEVKTSGEGLVRIEAKNAIFTDEARNSIEYKDKSVNIQTLGRHFTLNTIESSMTDYPWTFKEADLVAEVDGEEYYSIDGAIDEMTPGDTVKLTSDIEVDNDIVVDQDAVLDLNGHKITFNSALKECSIVAGMGATVQGQTESAAPTLTIKDGDSFAITCTACGGQLRYDKKVYKSSDDTYTTYGEYTPDKQEGETGYVSKAAAYDYADLRLQYKIVVPTSLVGDKENLSWKWDVEYGTEGSKATAEVQGEKYTSVDNGDGTSTITSNVTLTNIPAGTNGNLEFSTVITLTFVKDGTTYTVTQDVDTPLVRELDTLANSYTETDFSGNPAGWAYVQKLQELPKDAAA